MVDDNITIKLHVITFVINTDLFERQKAEMKKKTKQKKTKKKQNKLTVYINISSIEKTFF